MWSIIFTMAKNNGFSTEQIIKIKEHLNKKFEIKNTD